MEKIIGVLLFCLSCAAVAETTFWLEPQINFTKEKNISRLDGGLSGSITEHVGYFAFGQTLSNGYAQAYAGPNLKLACFEVGVGLGLEDAQTELRKASYLSANCGKFSALAIDEQGGSGRFRKLVVTYQVTESLKLGVMGETYLGFGPRVEYSINKNVTPWIAILRDRETRTTSAVVAVTWSW